MKNFDTVFNYQRSLFHWNRFRIQLAKACAAKNYSLMSEWVNDWLTIYPQDKNQQALAIVNQIELAHTEQGLFDAPTVEILQWLRYFTNLKPEAHYAWIWLIEISCQLKRWKEAQLAFKSLSKLQSLSAKMFAQLAEISVHLNDYDQAIYAYLSAWNSSFDKHYLTVISKLVSDHETIELSEMSLNLLTQLTQIYSDDVSLFSLIKDLNRYLPIQLLAKLPQGKLFAFERLTHLFVTVETDQDYDLVVDLLTELDQAQLLSTIPDWLAVELIWLSLNCVQNNLLIQQQKLQQLSIWSTVIQFDQQFPLLDVNRLKHREKLKMPIRSLTEFLALGTDRLLSPHILFNTLWYYNTEKLDPLSLPPLVHFFRYSNGFQIKITNPNPYFDTAWYRQSYLQEDFYQNPLLHYLKHFQDQNIQPCADFYSDYIRETQGLFTNEDSLTYYLEQLEANDLSFRLTGFSPCPWFERTFYLNHNQDINHGVNNSNLEPFAHFVNYGKKEGRLAYHWQKYNQLVRHQLLYLESFNLGSPITKDRLEYLIANDAEITYFAGQKILANQLSFRPLISILVPVFQVKPAFLIQMLDSVLAQTYSNWQLCLVDDASIRYREQIIEILTDYSRRDSRIIYQLREQNGHICRSSNDCFALAEGEFIALLDHDDLLTADALYEVVKTLNDNSDLDIIYSDEDKVDEWGIYSSPYYKPDWSPHTLWAKMYVCHLTVYRKTLIEMVHGFRVGFEGSQDYDLLLRCSENTQRIYHIPKVLYHWRIHHESTASGANAEGKDYCADAGRRAVEEALIRRGIEAEVSLIPGFGTALWAKPMVKNQPEIDILIPSRNASILLATCLQSIFNKSSYPHFKVTVIDNHSTEESFKQLMEYWLKQEPKRFQVLFDPQPFNFAKLNNDAVKQTQGDYLLFLNNDTEIISPDWLQGLLGYAQLPEVGAVGAKLYYADDTVQHAGVATGIGGVAGHVMKHFHISNNGYYSNLKMVTNYSAVTGACLMIQRDKFNAVNGFEEYLQVAFNDVDFCLKVREKGWFNVYLPFVELYHYESKSRGYEDTPEKKARFEKETLFLRQRWGKLLDNDPFYSPWLTLEREDMSFRFH
jgi:GT2 family glycosyltransferase